MDTNTIVEKLIKLTKSNKYNLQKSDITRFLYDNCKYDDLVDVIVALIIDNRNIENNNENKLKLSVPQIIIDELHLMIEERFRAINANGRGRRAIYADWEYQKQIDYLILNPTLSKTIKQRAIRNVYEQEKQRRINNGENIDNFTIPNIYNIDITNYQSKFEFDFLKLKE